MTSKQQIKKEINERALNENDQRRESKGKAYQLKEFKSRINKENSINNMIANCFKR